MLTLSHMGTRVIGYVRVSTEMQADGGHSLTVQREKLIAYARAMDLELVGIYEDAGQSAKSLDRPALKAALADLEAGKADGLLVAKLDRLTRSLKDLLTLIDEYFRDRYRLLSVGDSIDTDSAAGRLVLNMLAAVSQWEREAISERIRDSLTHLKAQGVRLGPPAFGSTDEERATVARMTELRSAGMSYRAIARQLDSEGHLTKKGGRWGGATVAAALERAAS